MKILALDFAWRNTGWVLVEDGDPIEWGVIKTKPRKKKNKSDKDPLKNITHETSNYNLIKRKIIDLQLKHNDPKTIAEVTYFSQKSFDGILIGMGWALLHQLYTEFLTGSQVKRILLNDPRASKDAIKNYVMSNGGGKLFFEKSDHVIDAYATYLAWASDKEKIKRKLTS